MTGRRLGPSLSLSAALLASSIVCQREQRDLRPAPEVSAASAGVVVSELRAGGVPPAVAAQLRGYQENAFAMNEGKRLFQAYNCTGCHAHGGGGIGPALMDEKWIYGSGPANVFATIVEGRPNGMPSFRGRIPDFQVAELVAYVRSMGGLTGQTWSPGRNDAMNVKKPENASDSQQPVREEGRFPP